MNTDTRSLSRSLFFHFPSILLCVASLAFAAGACSSDNEGDGDACPSSTRDTDGDGLTDCAENDTYGTSSVLADTDGDGLSDAREIVELGFNPDNNNFKFNPLIADLPKIGIELASLPDIRMQYTDTDSQTTEHTVSRTDTTVSADSTTNSTQNSTSVEVSESTKSSNSELVIFSSPIIKYSRTRTETTTDTETFGWSETHSSENSEALSQAESWAQSNSNTLTGGSILTTVQIANRGDLSFTVSSLTVGAVMLDPFSGEVMTPVGNLAFDNSATWQPFTLGPGSTTGNLVFSNTTLDAGITRQLLADSSGLMLEVATYELTNEEDVGFSHNLTDVMARTASVIIDYGLDRARETYMVATNVDAERLRVSAGDAMTDILRIPFTVSADGALASVRDVSEDLATNSYWIVAHASTDGVDETLVQYSPLDETYDFSALSLKSGDALNLIYFTDPDGDLLGDRQEFAFRSYPHLADSDSDGLEDGEEVYGFGLHPVRPDTDGDGKADPLERFLAVSAGGMHSVAIAADGTVWAWGNDDYYQIGRSSTGNCDQNDTIPPIEGCVAAPAQVGTENDWIAVSAGQRHTLAMKADGSLWAWGENEGDLLATGVTQTCNTATCTRAPAQVGTATDWQAIDAGGFFDLAIETNGSLWSWGKNDYGQLGTGDTVDQNAQGKVGTDTDWAEISAGYKHSLAIKTNGALWAWGLNYDGRLGTASSDTCNAYDCATSPLEVGADTDWVAVSAGLSHSAALKSDGSLWTWGGNSAGELGLGDEAGRAAPVQVPGTWEAVWAGHHYTLARSTDGSLWAWGGNWSSQLGVTTTDTCTMGDCSKSPLPVGTATDWLAVDAGADFALALRSFHQLWEWGSNRWWQLGQPTVDNCGSDTVPIACTFSMLFLDP